MGLQPVGNTDDRWQGYYRYTFVATASFLSVFLAIGPFSNILAAPSGLGRRIGFGIWHLWLVGLAVVLYRRDTHSDARTGR